MRFFIPCLFILGFLLIGLFAASCSRGPHIGQSSAAPSKPASVAKLIPTGDLKAADISCEFAVYYLPVPTKEPLVELDAILTNQFTTLQRVDRIEEGAKQPIVAARIETDLRKYAPPDLRSLQYFGHGITREQAEALQETKSVLILDFAYPRDHIWDGLRSAVELTHALANATGGLIWDDVTREAFSTDAWEERRIKDWSEEVPDVTKHTVIHSYKKDEYVRAITLGMSKFGLPDVVIENFSWSLNRNMGHVISLFAQALAEGATLNRPGEFDLDFKTIKNAKVREPQMTTLKPNATGLALLSLQQGTWEDGDPRNRLIEITFNRGEGPDLQARQEQVIGKAFGFEDAITPVKHDEELAAASRNARDKLPLLRAEFNKNA